tara:strand:+ start:61961 stop:62125 length:165 start_codon:yes stop_codon:yes gene_type:complete
MGRRVPQAGGGGTRGEHGEGATAKPAAARILLSERRKRTVLVVNGRAVVSERLS